MTSYIDITIVIGFLFLTLAIGIFYGRNIKTLREYAIGNQQFSTGVITSTIVGTWVGGNFFAFLISKTYSDGIFYVIPIFIDYVVTFFIIGYFIAPRMKEFLGSISVAEAMGNIYDKKVRIITAVSGILAVSGLIAIQFKVSASLLSYFFNISNITAILITSIVVVIYSSLGGIKSVTFTDVFQFFTFGTMIPLIGIIIWKDVDSINTVINTVTSNDKFYIKEFSFNDPLFFNLVQLSIIFIIPALHPSLFQRMSMAKNTPQLRSSFILASIISIFLVAATCWIGALMLSINPNVNPDELWIYVIDNYLSTGMKGLAIIGIIAMIMSTADSYINSSSILISHDLYALLSNQKKNELIISKITAFLIGILSIILAIFSTNLLSLMLLANNFYVPIVTVPLLLRLFGFYTSAKSALIAMSAGFITVIIWRVFLMDDTGIDSIIPAVLANLVFLLSSHYVLKQPGGWKKNQNNNTILNNSNYSVAKFNLLTFCKQNTPKSESTYILFAAFAIISIFSAIYTIPFKERTIYADLIEFTYFAALFISTGFFIYSLWPQIMKNEIFISFIWLISLFYVLTFFPGLQLIIGHFGQFQLMIFILSMVVLAMLVRWQMALFLMVTGVITSIQFFKWHSGIENIGADFGSLQFKIIYALLLISSILIAFFKPKQEYLEATETKVDELGSEVHKLKNDIMNLFVEKDYFENKIAYQEKEITKLGATSEKILRNVSHELRLPVGNVVNFSDMLSESLENFNKDQLRMISKDLFSESQRLSSMILNMLDLATLDVRKVELDKTEFDLSKTIKYRIDICRKIYLEGKDIKFKLDIQPGALVKLDQNYIKQTIDNLVINAINYSKTGTINITLTIENNGIKISVSDEGIGIPKEEIYDIFDPFAISSKTDTPAGGRGIGLALCKSAVEAHGGTITAESDGVKGAKFTFIIPDCVVELKSVTERLTRRK